MNYLKCFIASNKYWKEKELSWNDTEKPREEKD